MPGGICVAHVLRAHRALCTRIYRLL